MTPEIHNRSLVDQAFAQAGSVVQPVMETSSVLTLALSVLAGDVCDVLPGAVHSQCELEALPLVEPEMVTPVDFIYLARARALRVLEAALARDAWWPRHAVRYSGELKP